MPFAASADFAQVDFCGAFDDDFVFFGLMAWYDTTPRDERQGESEIMVRTKSTEGGAVEGGRGARGT